MIAPAAYGHRTTWLPPDDRIEPADSPTRNCSSRYAVAQAGLRDRVGLVVG
jgi:hypothetical protein